MQRVRSKYYKTPEGRLHYVVKPGKGTPIVAIHGVGSNHTVWRLPLQGIKNPLILIDMHGHGRSTPAWTQVNSVVSDIMCILSHEHVKRPILIGNSLGSSVALRLALKVKPRKLILTSPFFGDVIRGSIPIRTLCGVLSKLILQFKNHQFVDYSKHAKRPSLLYPFLDLKGTALRTWLRGASSCLSVKLSELPPAIPTLVVFGARDPFVLHYTLEQQLKKSQGAAVGMDCDHLLLYHRPASVGEIVREFIQTKHHLTFSSDQ